MIFLARNDKGYLRQIGGQGSPPYDRCVAVFLWQGGVPSLAAGYEDTGTIFDGTFTLTETGDTFSLIDQSKAVDLHQPRL